MVERRDNTFESVVTWWERVEAIEDEMPVWSKVRLAKP
jgi:hypothetical protein